jgi:hypothetical protein
LVCTSPPNRAIGTVSVVITEISDRVVAADAAVSTARK